MKKHHDLKIGAKGFYENKECEIIDFEDEITLLIEGMFGRFYYWDFYYKSRIHSFFRIKTKIFRQETTKCRVYISFWNFKI